MWKTVLWAEKILCLGSSREKVEIDTTAHPLDKGG